MRSTQNETVPHKYLYKRRKKNSEASDQTRRAHGSRCRRDSTAKWVEKKRSSHLSRNHAKKETYQ